MTGMAGGTGWVLDAVTVDGEDALDTPLEVRNRAITGVTITMGDRNTELSGTVVDEKGKPMTEHTLLLYPVDQKVPGCRSHAASARPAPARTAAMSSAWCRQATTG